MIKKVVALLLFASFNPSIKSMDNNSYSDAIIRPGWTARNAQCGNCPYLYVLQWAPGLQPEAFYNNEWICPSCNKINRIGDTIVKEVHKFNKNCGCDSCEKEVKRLKKEKKNKKK